jgi:hypothetical protein
MNSFQLVSINLHKHQFFLSPHLFHFSDFKVVKKHISMSISWCGVEFVVIVQLVDLIINCDLQLMS